MFNNEIKEKRDIINSDTDLENNQPDVTLQEIEHPKSTPKKSYKKGWIAAVATALAVVIVSVLAFNLQLFNMDDYIAPLPTKISHEEAYKIYKDIHYARSNHDKHTTYEHSHTQSYIGCVTGEYITIVKEKEGVEKQAIIKKYGEYIYTVREYHEPTVNITRTNKGELAVVSTIDIKSTPNFTRYDSSSIEGIFIYEDTLAVVLNSSDFMNEEQPQRNYTVVKLFDINNPYSPKYVTEYAQIGMGYEKSYLIDNVLYVFTYASPKGDVIGRDPQWHLPSVAKGKDDFVPVEELYTIDTDISESYFSGMSINLGSKKIIDSVAVVGCDSIHIVKDSVYVFSSVTTYINQNYTDHSKTSILKFDLKKGGFEPKAKTTLDGYIGGFIEYKDYFIAVSAMDKRVITDDCNVIKEVLFESNSVFVLDKKLRTISSITDLSKEKGIYGVRFLDDLAYFETYSKNLNDDENAEYSKLEDTEYFMIDFSNIKHPKLKLSVKSPINVSNLRVWNDDKLLNIYETWDENKNEIIKFTMFNAKNNDVINIEEISAKRFLNNGTDINLYTILGEKNIIGLANGSKYTVFSFDDKEGFKINNGNFSVPVDKESIQSEAHFARLTSGIFIDNYLYVCNYYGINSYNLSDSSKVDSLTFKKIS